jgi:hypothetical protein
MDAIMKSMVALTGAAGLPSRIWNRVPAVLAFALLAFQIAVPWTARHFITQDGPSHLYGATIARDLLVNHGHSVYSSLYTIQRTIVPNWTSTLALGLAESIVGPEYADALLVSTLVLIGFLGLSYANRAFSPTPSLWTPVSNVMIQSWFLSAGFYNFYLGMALLPFVIGFYARNQERLNLIRAIVLGSGLLVLFFTHVMPAAIAILTLLVIGFWISFVTVSPARIRAFGFLLVAVMPVVLLMAIYAHNSGNTGRFEPQIAKSWNQFPMQILGSSRGTPLVLTHMLLFYIVAGAVLMRKREWSSIRGGLLMSGLLMFLAYLLLPDKAFGGEALKIRFSWTVFILGGIMASSVSRLRMIRVPLALYLSCLLFANLVSSAKAARTVSRAADDYLVMVDQMPQKSSFVRLRYPTPALPALFGFEGIGWDPLFHLDGLVAAKRRLFDLTDYEAISKLFPVSYKETVGRDQQYGLWGFEGPEHNSVEVLAWLRDNFPAGIDFVVLIGDEKSAEASRADMPKMLEYLDSNMHLAGTSPSGFVRLYGRRNSSTNSLAPETYDDLDPEIEYAGNWLHDRQFKETWAASITYSRQPGDLFRLKFSGGAVTYYYTKASNRGLAQVTIDGRDVMRLNLYSETTQWQAHTTFDGLGGGQHTIEVRVLGQKDPSASDSWVDVDRLVVSP